MSFTNCGFLRHLCARLLKVLQRGKLLQTIRIGWPQDWVLGVIPHLALDFGQLALDLLQLGVQLLILASHFLKAPLEVP